MPITKMGGIVKECKTSEYGLNMAHHVLLEGCSFPPERKSSLAQSLGPLTALIMLSRAQSQGIYGDKWRDAVKRDMAHIPEIDGIINAVKGRPAKDVKELISALGDLLLITTGRNAHRAYFPIYHYCVALFTKEDYKAMIETV